MEHCWDHLGPFRALLGAFLGQVGAILGHVAETVFVYERSEGLPGSNDHLEVPERGESCLTPDLGPCWGHLGRRLQ